MFINFHNNDVMKMAFQAWENDSRLGSLGHLAAKIYSPCPVSFFESEQYLGNVSRIPARAGDREACKSHWCSSLFHLTRKVRKWKF